MLFTCLSLIHLLKSAISSKSMPIPIIQDTGIKLAKGEFVEIWETDCMYELNKKNTLITFLSCYIIDNGIKVMIVYFVEIIKFEVYSNFLFVPNCFVKAYGVGLLGFFPIEKYISLIFNNNKV